MLLLPGCVQRASTPEVNEHLARRLRAAGRGVISVEASNCCGSLDLHLGATEAARAHAKATIAAIDGLLEGTTAVVSTASGCGVTIKDYARLLADDAEFAERARRVADATLDVAEYLTAHPLPDGTPGAGKRVAWHAPCTFTHGQGLADLIEPLLVRAGYQLTQVAQTHLCCGSAGTYSYLQPELASALRERKLAALCGDTPDVIATANVGCQLHLDNTHTPVVHWVTLL